MLGLPEGTVTFLFTDVVGSTKRWERYPEAMQFALRRHDDILNEAIASCGGHVFKTVGDAFCAAFVAAEPAARAAALVQRLLDAENWDGVGGLPVRVALHTGSVQSRAHDYFGPAVNRVARLLALAHGGQVLLSGATAALLPPAALGDLSLLPLGLHRLRDVTDVEDVYQLLFTGGRAVFPALASAATTPNNLPHEVTSFVGGDRVVEEACALLRATRLVTLCGTGGVGKTRTALRIASEYLPAAVDGVWFVGLASLGDAALVTAAVASALGLADAGARSTLETLLEHLRERRLLLVLDNCEHIVEAAAELASTLASRCSGVSILATSREPLRVAGEAVYAVAPLALPAFDPAALPSLAELETSPAIRLFLDRARSVSPAFVVGDDDRSALFETCRRLDGIPLAIELAAARVTMFSLPALAERLKDRFSLLSRGSRNAVPHHRTLRALVDWSFDLLSEPERTLFRRLAIFAGSWSLEDAESIAAGTGLERYDVLPLLETLCEKSLVQVEPGEVARFRLLETIRAYAAEKLREAGEEGPLERTLVEHYTALVSRAEPHWRARSQREWLARVEVDVDNLRAALDIAEREPSLHEAGLTMAGGLARYWVLKGALVEGRLRLERQTADSRGSPAALARALCGAAIIALNYNTHAEFHAYARRALDVAERGADPWTLAWANAVYSFRLSLAPETPDESDDAFAAHVRARRLAGDMDDPWILAHLDVAAAARAASRGDERAVLAHEEAALAHARRSGDTVLVASCSLHVAYRIGAASARRSASLFAESLSLLQPENVLGFAASFEGAGRLAADLSAFDVAATMLAVGARFRHAAGVPAWRFHPNDYRERVAVALDRERFSERWNAGSAMAVAEAVSEFAAFAASLPA